MPISSGGVGLITSIDDINAIAIKNNGNGVPILIKDIAKVGYGNAVRYGALTYNGEKEAVGGIVMMLKGANSAEVVGRVKEKLETIKKSLAGGCYHRGLCRPYRPRRPCHRYGRAQPARKAP